MEYAEGLLNHAVLWLRLGVELVGAVVIGVGCVVAALKLLRTWRAGSPVTFTGVRLSLAQYLALGLEFQLAADILVTAIAPTWEEIGKLAAIAAIRTTLNYFLAREMQEERAEVRAEHSERPGETTVPIDSPRQHADRVTTP
jgi:uncharacterized membrane protein